MIRINFLNVGQGDSIIIEYITGSEKKIAIVDCCLYNKSNPVLDYIIDNSYEQIDYLIMSHPHYDHFSGFHQLLQYCNENGISIKYFLHTFLNFPAYLTSIKGSPKEGNELIALFDYIKDNRTDMGFKLGAIHADMPNNSFNIGGCMITILSPGADEYDRFINSANYNTVETAETLQNLPNWLSTVLFLKLESGFVLFTSDCEKSALHRIDKNEREILRVC